jgi:Ca2+-binding RTX toxin-like protein
MDFFDLTNDSDNRTFNPGELSGKPVRSLDGNDTVTGSSDDDDINGNLGNDIISGSDGRDFMRGGQGADTVNGGNGDDTVNGNIGNDLVNGNDGADQVRGGQNDDTLNGNDGDDILLGDLGLDRLTGGSGSDVFVLQKSKGTDTITDFDSSTDRFFLEGLTPSNLAAADSGGNTTITDQLTGEIVAIVQGVNSVTVGAALGNAVDVSTRADLRGSAANAAGGFNNTNIQPVSGWTGSVQITAGSGWNANGSFTILNGVGVFKINPDDNNVNDQVLLELTGNTSVRFTQSTYNFAETAGTVNIPFNLSGVGFTSATINILE